MNHREMRNPMSEIFSDDDSAKLFQLIHMFQRSALVNMGLMPDIEGKIIYNLPESKEAIAHGEEFLEQALGSEQEPGEKIICSQSNLKYFS